MLISKTANCCRLRGEIRLPGFGLANQLRICCLCLAFNWEQGSHITKIGFLIYIQCYIVKQVLERKENMRSWQPWYKNSSWKSTFQAKMGSIKDINGLERTEAEVVITRGGKNTKKNYTKRSSWPRYPRWCDHPPRARHPGMWSQVGLGSITTNKASGGDGIPVELFQILKDDAVKVLYSIC